MIMKLHKIIEELQGFYLLCLRSLLGVFQKPFYFRDAIEQMDYAGAGSFLIVFLVSLFIGMALSLQISTELSSLGAGSRRPCSRLQRRGMPVAWSLRRGVRHPSAHEPSEHGPLLLGGERPLRDDGVRPRRPVREEEQLVVLEQLSEEGPVKRGADRRGSVSDALLGEGEGGALPELRRTLEHPAFDERLDGQEIEPFERRQEEPDEGPPARADERHEDHPERAQGDRDDLAGPGEPRLLPVEEAPRAEVLGQPVIELDRDHAQLIARAIGAASTSHQR